MPNQLCSTLKERAPLAPNADLQHRSLGMLCRWMVGEISCSPGWAAAAHLQALQRLGMEALPVESHAGVAVQHGGALVDGGGGAEVVVRLRPLLLPQVHLPDAVPAGT